MFYLRLLLLQLSTKYDLQLALLDLGVSQMDQNVQQSIYHLKKLKHIDYSQMTETYTRLTSF